MCMQGAGSVEMQALTDDDDDDAKKEKKKN